MAESTDRPDLPGVEMRVAIASEHEARVVIAPASADPELTALTLVAAALEPLDPAARRRVVDWAWARWHADPDR